MHVDEARTLQPGAGQHHRCADSSNSPDMSHCVEAPSSAGNLSLCRFGKYELHDLVVLDQQTTGIIISVEKDTCRVLTTEVKCPTLAILAVQSFCCNLTLANSTEMLDFAVNGCNGHKWLVPALKAEVFVCNCKHCI